MPYGSWINELPTSFFLAVHIAAFTIGASFAWFAFKREQPCSASPSRCSGRPSSST